ncbi:Nucleobase-ascorbate transporter 12, partial [Cucurbita argyrosperma subsp. argyrosperma]
MSTSDPKSRTRPAPDPSSMPPSSWAKRTGFRPNFSGETNSSDSAHIALPPRPKDPDAHPDLEAGRPRGTSAVNGDPTGAKAPSPQPQPPLEKDQPVKRRKDSDGLPKGSGPAQNGHALPPPPPPPSEPPNQPRRLPQTGDDDGFVARHSHMKYELRDTPGLVPIGVYGLQHYISMLGSLVLIPLVIVPAMGGTHFGICKVLELIEEDTSNVVSTVLFVSGITTLLHTSFGSRLPLIQGPSLVFLAPALAIINSTEFQGLNGNELQGAIIIASAFQALLGYSGLMSLLLRLIHPVVVAPTIAAVGLSFYSYGFPVVGACLEIGVVQILLAIIFSLVPLGIVITWALAFLLTEAGVYSYKGCDTNVPASNIISDHCRKHVSRMKHCRVDTSYALKSSPWFRFPYPLQWGTPVFHWKTAIVMCVVSVISSVDSVGSYHAASLLVASRPPSPGILSRGIGLEGLSSILAGLWGTGTGSTTLTENVHTIAVTKMGSRRAVELGACILIVLSLVGKVGGLIASIPDVMVAALLCFMWAMLTALGLSNLRYSEAGSSRNIIIVGLSLFFSLSIPAYFQQYGISPGSNLSLNFILNTLFSLHMVIAFLVAIILDNTVPGSRQERGVYVWSDPETARREPAVTKDYELPFRVGRVFRWVKWVGF